MFDSKSETKLGDIALQTFTKQSNDDELLPPWRELMTEAGEIYYWNGITGISSWTKPTASNLIDEQQHFADDTTNTATTKVKGSRRHRSRVSMQLYDVDRPRVDIQFRRVSRSITINKESVRILGPVSGQIATGTMHAIMGPSGCGKTTLLDILAGKSTAPFQGSILINDQEIPKNFQRMCAYVPQADILCAQLTVFETLYFYANLRIPETVSHDDKLQHIGRLLHILGLQTLGNTIIGDNMIRGISGGQKKRLSIAKALLGAPSVVFLDEPTSGLSSFDSKLLIDALRNIVDNCNTTMIAVIHQPRSSVFYQFDRLLLLSKGQVLYNGDVNDSIAFLHDRLHLVQPKDVSDADWLLDLVSPNSPHQAIELLAKEAQRHLVDTVIASGNDADVDLVPEFTDRCFTSAHNQFLVLGQFFKVRVARDASELYQRIVNAVFMSSLIGAMFYQESESITTTASVLFLSLLCTSMSCLEMIPKFVHARVLFQIDSSEGLYNAAPYYLATSFLYFCVSLASTLVFSGIVYFLTGLRADDLTSFGWFLGIVALTMSVIESIVMLISILATSAECASAATGLILGFCSMFSGLIANPATLRIYMQWPLWLSPLWYAFELLMINEFEHRKFPDEILLKSDEAIFDQYGIDSSRFTIDLLALVTINIICRVLGIICLQYCNKRSL